jgi:hypothetical protein
VKLPDWRGACRGTMTKLYNDPLNDLYHGLVLLLFILALVQSHGLGFTNNPSTGLNPELVFDLCLPPRPRLELRCRDHRHKLARTRFPLSAVTQHPLTLSFPLLPRFNACSALKWEISCLSTVCCFAVISTNPPDCFELVWMLIIGAVPQ